MIKYQISEKGKGVVNRFIDGPGRIRTKELITTFGSEGKDRYGWGSLDKEGMCAVYLAISFSSERPLTGHQLAEKFRRLSPSLARSSSGVTRNVIKSLCCRGYFDVVS